VAKLKIDATHSLVTKAWELAVEIIKNDSSFELWAIKFRFDMEKKEKELTSLEFLKLTFAELEDLLE
jgi:hypothetical protein